MVVHMWDLGPLHGSKTGGNMKANLTSVKTLCMYAAALMMTGCSSQKETSGNITASIVMTGANQTATVAGREKIFDRLLDLVVPKAFAFVPPSMVDSTGAPVSLTSAWIVIKEIEFESEETGAADETDGDEIEFQGPYAVNLLSTSPAVLDTKEIPQGNFRRIKMKLHKPESAVTGAPPQLVNNSIYFVGSVGSNSFTFESDDTTEFEIGGPNPVLPSDGSSILVQIQLANVMKQIDLSGLPNGATVSASNRYSGANLCPAISASATDVYTCFRLGLRKHADWGEDRDGDDDLDSSDSSVK